MTVGSVDIIITVEINGKRIKKGVEVEAADLDRELQTLLNEALCGGLEIGLEALDEELRKKVAGGWQNLGREKRCLLTSVGEVVFKRRVYRDGEGSRRKPLDELLGLVRYQRETNTVRMMGAWLATQSSYRDAAVELSYLLKSPITPSKIQRLVWVVGNKLADQEEAEIAHWDGAEKQEHKISTAVLYAESDGVLLSLQREQRRKAEARVGILYSGKKGIAQGRKRLENKVCMTRITSDSQEWMQLMQKLADKTYDLRKVKYLVSGGDGSSWVRRSFEYLPVARRAHVLDRYHLYRASRTALGFSPESLRIVKQVRLAGWDSVADLLTEMRERAKGKEKERMGKFIHYLQANQDALQDVYLAGHTRASSLGAIEGNVDKLVVRRMKGRGRSWRIPGARAMLTLCRYRPQLRDLVLKLTNPARRKPSKKRKRSVDYSSWLQCDLALFSGSDRNQPWVKELKRKVCSPNVLSMEYL